MDYNNMGMKKPPCSTDFHRREKLEAFDRLLTVMDELRENCPWDKKQTWESLRYLTIEEMYELSDAILENNHDAVKKEIGDVMLHLIFYARIARECGLFDIQNVLHSICDKLIERHPHVYGDTVAEDEHQVKKNWEQIKLKTGNSSVLEGVPVSLPALVKAMRIQEKARGIGFDWEHKSQVWDKVEEELQEFRQECTEENGTPIHQEKAMEEFGDLLFSLVNYSRFLGIDAEEALERTNKKFIRRFMFMEHESKNAGREFSTLTLAEMEELWEKAKKNM